jgi:hypothetical protein
MGAPVIDESEWPLVVVIYPRIMRIDEEEKYYERLAGYLDRGERFAVLLDARPADVPNALERARIVAFWQKTAKLSARYLAGVALVVKTTLGRGVLSAVLWLYTPPFAIRTFSSLFEARKWLGERLTAAG